ncbi:MAG: hypothetical protein ACK5MW_09350 [Enterococcus sp.]
MNQQVIQNTEMNSPVAEAQNTWENDYQIIIKHICQELVSTVPAVENDSLANSMKESWQSLIGSSPTVLDTPQVIEVIDQLIAGRRND